MGKISTIVLGAGLFLQIILIVRANENVRNMRGMEASEGQFPFYVFFHVPDFSINKICSGSIIGSRHILTTASCALAAAQDLSKFLVIAGCVDVQNTACTKYQVENVDIHPKGDKGEHEVAILTLTVELVLSDNVKITPLSKKRIAIDKESIVTKMGWIGDQMYYVDAKIITTEECVKKLKVDGIPDQVFCTQPGFSTWTTFGSPVVVNGEQVGITVLENQKLSGGHLRVEYYYEFIQNVLKNSDGNSFKQDDNRMLDEL